MAERLLDGEGIPRETWTGIRFEFGENHDGFFASVLTGIERRGEQWIVVRLDRNKASLPDHALGLHRSALTGA